MGEQDSPQVLVGQSRNDMFEAVEEDGTVFVEDLEGSATVPFLVQVFGLDSTAPITTRFVHESVSYAKSEMEVQATWTCVPNLGAFLNVTARLPEHWGSDGPIYIHTLFEMEDQSGEKADFDGYFWVEDPTIAQQN